MWLVNLLYLWAHKHKLLTNDHGNKIYDPHDQSTITSSVTHEHYICAFVSMQGARDTLILTMCVLEAMMNLTQCVLYSFIFKVHVLFLFEMWYCLCNLEPCLSTLFCLEAKLILIFDVASSYSLTDVTVTVQ